MPKGGARFTSSELAAVLSHYDIGIIQQIKPLSAGNRKAPKQIIISDSGKYLLKRRSHNKDDRYRVAFSHSVQKHLQIKSYKIPKLIETKDEKTTILELNNNVYELFEFVQGNRFDGSAESVRDAGAMLAEFHIDLSDFPCQAIPIKRTFHDSHQVRRHLKHILSTANGSEPKMKKTAEKMMVLYNYVSTETNQRGFDSWGQQIIHGDWHPGNMLFLDGHITAVLDFDSLKVSVPITDLANGALQYSIVGGRPNPADWPDYLDQARLTQFLSGYFKKFKPQQPQINSLMDLMIETLIAETVLPIAATGSFVHMSGSDFLEMIHRKCKWIQDNKPLLDDSINFVLSQA